MPPKTLIVNVVFIICIGKFPQYKLEHVLKYKTCIISEEEIDGESILSLNEDDLLALFPKRGPRAKFRGLLQKLKVNNYYVYSIERMLP